MTSPVTYPVKIRVLEQHYTAAQAASFLACHVNTIYQAIKKGSLTKGKQGIYPVAHVGDKVRIPASSLSAWSGAATFFAENPPDA